MKEEDLVLVGGREGTANGVKERDSVNESEGEVMISLSLSGEIVP